MPGRCKAAYACLVVMGLAALVQALILAQGIYERYVYRNWKRPLGFIFESLQWEHWLNLFWFWPTIVVALIAAFAFGKSGQTRLICTRSVIVVALLTLLLVPMVDYLSVFVWEAGAWKLLTVYLIYGVAVLYFGIRGYAGLRNLD